MGNQSQIFLENRNYNINGNRYISLLIMKITGTNITHLNSKGC